VKWRSVEESAPQSHTRSLRDIYAERKALIAKYVSQDIQAVHARIVAELQHSGMVDKALKPGSDLPEFELSDQNGSAIRSTNLLQNGPVVLFFIRGRWCPFCIAQLEAINSLVPHFQSLGASMVAISPQTVHQNSLMADQHKLRFPVLSDAGNKVAKVFGLAYRVPEYQQEIYGRAFVNLPFVNGDESWQLPIPATYIAKMSGTNGVSTHDTMRQGKVIYAFPNPDYTDRAEPAVLLDLLWQGQS